MKILFVYLTIVLFVFSQNLFSQIPLGKDFNIGKQEIKLFMQKNGFHFLKEEHTFNYNPITGQHDIPNKSGILLLFKEEVTISIEKNSYDNINLIHIYHENKSSFNKLLENYGFNKWKYLYSKNTSSKCDYYQVNDCYAILIGGEQINFLKNIEP